MTWTVTYLEEAKRDLKNLDGSQRILVRKAIEKVRQNPVPKSGGGYGKPLGNKHNNDLTGFLKIKLRNSGIRVVYKLVRNGNQMKIIVIGAREDDEVYRIAGKRANDHDL